MAVFRKRGRKKEGMLNAPDSKLETIYLVFQRQRCRGWCCRRRRWPKYIYIYIYI